MCISCSVEHLAAKSQIFTETKLKRDWTGNSSALTWFYSARFQLHVFIVGLYERGFVWVTDMSERSSFNLRFLQWWHTEPTRKKKCDWVLWFTEIAYRNGDLKYEDAPLEQCFYDRFNIIISTDMDNYYYLSLQTSPRSSREILLLLHQWGLFGEEKKGTSDFLGQVSSPSSKISIWSSKQAFSNLVLPLSFFSFCFL